MVGASRWVSRITNIALEMVLPAVCGHWLDGRWGTKPWLVSIGAILGMIVAMTTLLRLAKQDEESHQGESKTEKNNAKSDNAPSSDETS